MVLILAPWALRAINLTPTTQDIERALKIGRAADKERTTFHARYIHKLAGRIVRQIEIVTEFRRYVLTTEDRARIGDWMFSQGVRTAQDALRPFRGRLSVIAHIQFDPLNTYSQVPPLTLIVGGLPDIDPLSARVTPESSLPFQSRSGQTTTYLSGATLESEFDAASLAQAERPVSILLDGKELERVVIDFRRVE